MSDDIYHRHYPRHDSMSVVDHLEHAFKACQESRETWKDLAERRERSINNLAWLALAVTFVERIGR